MQKPQNALKLLSEVDTHRSNVTVPVVTLDTTWLIHHPSLHGYSDMPDGVFQRDEREYAAQIPFFSEAWPVGFETTVIGESSRRRALGLA